MNLFHNFHKGMLPLYRIKFGIITLVPKQNEARDIKDVQIYLSVKCEVQIFYKGGSEQTRESGL